MFQALSMAFTAILFLILLGYVESAGYESADEIAQGDKEFGNEGRVLEQNW